MEDLGNQERVCSLCGAEFSTISSRNRHLRNIHEVNSTTTSKSHIVCPLCKTNEMNCGTYKKLENHLALEHDVKVEFETHHFPSSENYEHWFETEKLERIYAVHGVKKYKDYILKSYVCNRSNSKGFESKSCKRMEKAGGSIKIYGVCPSRIETKILLTGETFSRYWKKHVGHEEEIRNQHLSKHEKKEIVKKLCDGVTVERIISDARNIKSDKLQRLNLLNRKDISYLSKKHNVLQKKHENTMIAVNLKVKEWNDNGRNYCFFFKQQGEHHPILNSSDFCLGFMNSVMETKLKNFSRIICMDGTHCTNQKGMDLTIMLVKDDRNMGFPVAFFLSNRLDQITQEVFMQALREKVVDVIHPEYFMSDDDPKYYNAWVKVMGNRPRRLLCTWHVIKNWVIQGRSKIRNQEIRKSMKFEMKKILNEMDVQKFKEKSQRYFEKLENAEELVFLNYLKKYYYQSEERIAMWAHSYRLYAGINTNMALESLNNILKTNQLKRKANVTIDLLLNEIENLVDGKMWQRILKMERPHSNNYQDRLVVRAHKAAEILHSEKKTEVLDVGFGEFLVKSSTGDKFYKVVYHELCEIECRTLFCKICKVCIHRYRCECPEFAIKTNMCKHIHLVCLHEQRSGSDSVLGDVAIQLSLEKPSVIKEANSEEIQDFIKEKKWTMEICWIKKQ
ncbi:uncharacterized protein LOC123318880 [Coccinella septempunctata]|uniref:uncharacterized protein LOC123318880 n=1 Tax=Coccinella septempunctata TaxID=41139 RepID=UPI001D0715DF|nr:uncharacterized protein LOC123318880 [Coccinella septempunctata]